MKTIQVGDACYTGQNSSELVSLLVSDVQALGEQFPFEALSDAEVAEVYRRMSGISGPQADTQGSLAGWMNPLADYDDARYRLQRMLWSGRVKYVYFQCGTSYFVDFGDMSYLCSREHLIMEMEHRYLRGSLNFEQVPEALWELVRECLTHMLQAAIQVLKDNLTPLEVANGPLRYLHVFSHLVPPKTSLIWRGVMGYPPSRFKSGVDHAALLNLTIFQDFIMLWDALGRGAPRPILVARQVKEVLSGGWEEVENPQGLLSLREALFDGALIMVDPNMGQKGDRMAETRRWLLGEGA